MADSPKEGEAAQALFCAIVDLKGAPFPSNIPNYIVFKQKYKREINTVRRKVVTPGVTESGIEKLLLKDNDWFLSSINIANKISCFLSVLGFSIPKFSASFISSAGFFCFSSCKFMRLL